MEENEALKADVKDLQQEIEEMQDQYREEEIEEFRELQRELEQNAKNCRILQFKLRKSERVRDQLETEKQHLEAKVRDLLQASAGKQSPTPGGQAKQTDPIRIKELESELRIAKEVSVRLHNELEGAEEKRYKLEDEVFYLKEKCRELQTQTKWREARNKAEQQAKRISNDLSMSLNDIDLAKEMRDVLEREADLRDQLKFAEEDLKRTQLRLQDVENENEELMRKLTRATTAKRPPMVRSVSEGHTQIQLELAEHEVEHLSTKVDRLEKKNVHLAKKILEMEMDSKKFSREGTEDAGGNKYVRFDISPEMQRDMGKMIATISELERKNMELNLQLKRQSETCSPSSDETVQTELRIEKEHKKIIENELLEMKKLMLQSENQKLIALATKVELLNNQLGLANERYNSFHRKMVKEGDDDTAYVDALKLKCEELEKQLSEQKANAKLVEVQGGTATADEIEQCCEVLASVETQTNRICKQIEKLENAQKDERRRSLSKDNSATIIAELASVITELNNVHQLLEAHKLNNPSFTRKSPAKEMLTKAEIVPCEKCKENEAFIESQRDEIIFYKKKNKDLTNQVLQTEDRWTVEIEKQRQAFELEMKNLNMKLINAEKCVEEQNQLIESRTVALAEKSRMIQERDEKCERLKVELQKLKKEIQEIEADHKSAREYEIKYKKLESLYDKEREKFAQERNKSKAEVAALKKRSEDTSVDLEKLRNAHLKKETMWNEEKERLEAENTALREQIKMGGSAVAPDEPVYATIPAKTSTELDEKDSDKPDVIEMREHITLLEKMHTEQAIEISTLKLQNEELQSELSRTQQNWTRDKDNLQHKVRTDEKIRNVEFDALQQKFASRMKIMEETNKSLHSQLVQARRERDYNREALCTFERKVAEEQQRMEKETKRQSDLSQKCADMTKQIAMLEAEVDRVSTDLTLTKDAHNADKALWEIERSRFGGNQEGETVVNGNAAEAEPGSEVRQLHVRYSVYFFFVPFQLREQIKVLEISQRNLMQARDMQTGAKEAMEAEIEKLQETVHQSEVQRLTRKYKLCSIIDQVGTFKVVFSHPDFSEHLVLLQTVIEPSYRAARHELDAPDMLRYILAQMKTINDEDATFTKSECKYYRRIQTKIATTYRENNEGCTSQASTSNHLGERTGPVGSESVGASRTDGIMNTSVSFKTYSYNSLPPASRKFVLIHFCLISWERSVRFRRWGSHMATITTTAAGIENSSTWEFRRNEASARAVSPVKKIAAYPDPPPNFMLNKEMSVEYDKEGRLHYIPRTISRSASYDRQGESLAVGVNGERSSLTDDDDGMLKALHSRTSSTGDSAEADSLSGAAIDQLFSSLTGTNILYKIRREELARGGQPSVRLMAKAFDSIEATVKKPQSSKRSLFSIRKSRSVETTETGRSIGAAAKSVLTPAAPSPMAVTVLGRNTSLSEIEQLMGSQSPYEIKQRLLICVSFELLGTKLVERVRRSLSRSSTGRNSTAPTDSETGSAKSGSRQTLNGDGVTEASPSGTGASSTSTSPKVKPQLINGVRNFWVAQGVTPTPVVAPKRTMKKKVKKAATTNLADITTKSSTTKTKS
ncbi:unnamed protein product [Toxocara canis]|uniref:Protein SOGA2 n=1 Tax=Toxocara canis TaxID=6265 RepID=A0A183UJ79_TOXCA|nr:unnamed protein product [Toxocara canis]